MNLTSVCKSLEPAHVVKHGHSSVFGVASNVDVLAWVCRVSGHHAIRAMRLEDTRVRKSLLTKRVKRKTKISIGEDEGERHDNIHNMEVSVE